MSIVSAYWPLVLENLKGKISPSKYQAWFSNLRFVKIEESGKTVVLSVHSVFNKEYIEKNFYKDLLESLLKYYPRVTKIAFQIDKKQTINNFQLKTEVIDLQNPIYSKNSKNSLTKNSNLSLDIQFDRIKFAESSISEKILPRNNITNLNARYTLENFIVTNYNEIAFSVAQGVIRDPGQSYNPVFIYSEVGLGKTHLLQAIGNKMLQEYPHFKIRYTTCETFLNYYVYSMQKNRSEEFREYYREIDLLLIDDIQFIAGKESTQDAFFHTFNELYAQNKQIIISSDKPPRFLDNVEERLVSRFNSGMLVHLSKPDLESRIAITKGKVSELKIPLLEKQILQIAQTIQTNIRDLIGVLHRLQAKSKLNPGMLITDQDLNKELEQFQERDKVTLQSKNTVSLPESILQETAKILGIKIEDILSFSKKKNVVLARQIVMYLYHKNLHFSFPVIAKMLQRNNHTTIIHGCNKIKRQLKTQPFINQKLQEITNTLGLSLNF